MKKKIWPALKILFTLWIISSVVSMFFNSNTGVIVNGNVAVIPIHGIITVSKTSGFTTTGVTSQGVITNLEKAYSNPGIKAVILDINSPGGSGVAADEISQVIKLSNKTTIAVIRDVGASAAYWIASSTDYIYSNRLSLVGSIGVIGSYLDFSDFITEYNITYQRYVSGEYKDMGSMFKKPTEKERELWQDLIDQMRDMFVEEVALNRNIPVKNVDMLSDGRLFLGVDAKKLNLVDELGTKKDALFFIANTYNITVQPVEFKEKKSFSDYLSEFKTGKFINSDPTIQFK